MNVVFESDDFYIVDKPAPLPCQCSQRQTAGTLENRLAARFGEPFVFRPLNRLDKGTSGLLCAAKHAHACQLLQKELHTGGFCREYLAVVEGIVDGRIYRGRAHRQGGRGQRAPRGRSGARQALGDARPRRGARQRPHAFAPEAGNGAHASDPRTHGAHRPSRGRRFPLRAGGRGAAGALRAALGISGARLGRRRAWSGNLPCPRNSRRCWRDNGAQIAATLHPLRGRDFYRSRIISYIIMPAATAALSDSARPRMGSLTSASACARTASEMPWASLPMTRTKRSPTSGLW